ncbi:hypothetical protein BD769DRAFT_182187 [Suillus cothurnatus]|nr:hypothetical protein BD769DRAFT_182187 [Suillus cothurnatus]
MDNLGALLLVLILLLEPHRPPTVLQPLILAAAVNVRQNTASKYKTLDDVRHTPRELSAVLQNTAENESSGMDTLPVMCK